MKLQIVPAGPLLNVPRPTLDPESDCVLVRSEVCFTPADLWAPRPRLARLAEVCKAMPKVLAYARLEGMRQTWAKLKAKRLAQGCALGEAAFSVAGSVEQTGERAAGLSPGDRVAACGFGQAACAGYYVVKEEQCTLLQGPAEKEWAACTTFSNGLGVTATKPSWPQPGPRSGPWSPSHARQPGWP